MARSRNALLRVLDEADTALIAARDYADFVVAEYEDEIASLEGDLEAVNAFKSKLELALDMLHPTLYYEVMHAHGGTVEIDTDTLRAFIEGAEECTNN